MALSCVWVLTCSVTAESVAISLSQHARAASDGAATSHVFHPVSGAVGMCRVMSVACFIGPTGAGLQARVRVLRATFCWWWWCWLIYIANMYVV